MKINFLLKTLPLKAVYLTSVATTFVTVTSFVTATFVTIIAYFRPSAGHHFCYNSRPFLSHMLDKLGCYLEVMLMFDING